MPKILSATISLCVFCGCTTREITIGGSHYKSSRFGNKEAISEIEFRRGDEVFIVRGWKSDQVEAIGIAVEAAARGAVSAFVPSTAVKSTPPIHKGTNEP